MTAQEQYREKYEQYTDEELESAISQLSAEIAMPGGTASVMELQVARRVAEERGLFA